VDHLADNATMDRVAEEMAPHVDPTPEGGDDFVGRKTRRSGSMIARSPASSRRDGLGLLPFPDRL
jgi:hypothetical protein